MKIYIFENEDTGVPVVTSAWSFKNAVEFAQNLIRDKSHHLKLVDVLPIRTTKPVLTY